MGDAGFCQRLGRASDEDEAIRLLDEMMRVISRIVYRAVFGVELGPDQDRVSTFQPMMESVGDVHWSLVAPGGKIDAGATSRLAQTRALADEEIAWLLESRRSVDVGVDDALGRLLAAQADGQIDEKGIHDEVRSLVLAATETSANSLVWCLLLLDDHSGVIESIDAELKAGLGDAAIDAAIWETLRLFPPVWANERQAIEITVQGERTWELGDRAVISAYRLHRDPKYWNEPDLFRPERFAASSDGRRQPPHRFAYMPFGAGPHLCIGRNLTLLEMRRIIREIISGFRVEFESPGEIEPDTRNRDAAFRSGFRSASKALRAGTGQTSEDSGRTLEMAGMNSTEISTWIRERIARELGSEASAIDPEVTFDRIGLDSLPLLGVLGDLALELDIEIETSVLFDHPTISGLATHLAGS